MEPLKLAMIATGRIADMQLAPALAQSRGAILWSVLSRSADRAASFARKHGAASGTPAYTDLEGLVADPELDGVIIASPDRLHAEQTLTAVRAGKHVLVEKPMATSTEDGAAMVAAAAEAGVRLGVAYHLRWHAGHREIVRRAREGALGELRHVRAQWTWPAQDDLNWRAHPAVGRWWSLAGVGTHCLDLIRWILVPEQGEVRWITGVTSRSVWKGPHDETAVVAIELESGATAEFCSSVQFASPSRLEVYGRNDYAIGTGTLGPRGGGSIVTAAGELQYEIANPYVGEVEDFVQAIRDRRPPEVDGREGLRNVELLEKLG